VTAATAARAASPAAETSSTATPTDRAAAADPAPAAAPTASTETLAGIAATDGLRHGAATAATATTAATSRDATADAARTVPLAQLPETIASQSRAGHSRFDIRLSPAELGGIDVRVEVRSTGEVRAHLVVERTETLDLMLRDQRHLERSLSDAGLDVSSSGLQFSLKEQPSGQSGQGWRTYDEAAARTDRPAADEDDAATVAPVAALAYRTARAGGVDLRV
jgi:flagellar hook-length control protein FliK